LLFLLLIVKQCSQKSPMFFYQSTNERRLKITKADKTESYSKNLYCFSRLTLRDVARVLKRTFTPHRSQLVAVQKSVLIYVPCSVPWASNPLWQRKTSVIVGCFQDAQGTRVVPNSPNYCIIVYSLYVIYKCVRKPYNPTAASAPRFRDPCSILSNCIQTPFWLKNLSLEASASVFHNYATEYPIHTEQKEAGLLFLERCTLRGIKGFLGSSLGFTILIIHWRWHYINNDKE